jgi:NADPH2:quinone reductase
MEKTQLLDGNKTFKEEEFMKAACIKNISNVQPLKTGKLPKPVPDSKEILIRVKHAGVNPIDWLNLEGVLQDMLPHEFPLIPGWDTAGIVEDLGSEASQFKVGNKVFSYYLKAVVKDGSFAEYLVVDESQVALMPSNFNFSEAAATPLAVLTAFQALHESLSIATGQSIVITGAAGGVGSFAVQFAKLAGTKVIAIASERHHEYLKDLGADFVVDYSLRMYPAKLKRISPKAQISASIVLALGPIPLSWKAWLTLLK